MKKIKFTGRPSDYFIQDGSEVKLNKEKLLSLISHKTDDLSVRNIVNTFFSDCDNAVKSNIIGFILYEIQYIRKERLNNPDILKKEASKIANRRLIIIGVIVTIIVITLFSWFLTQKPSLKCPSESSVWTVAQNIIKEKLKAPSTASFPYSGFSIYGDIEKKNLAICEFEMAGYVDAQNSFGAKIRSTYAINLTYEANTEKWYYKNLKIEALR